MSYSYDSYDEESEIAWLNGYVSDLENEVDSISTILSDEQEVARKCFNTLVKIARLVEPYVGLAEK